MMIGSELFRQGPRPIAMACSGIVNWVATFVIALAFEPVQVSTLNRYHFNNLSHELNLVDQLSPTLTVFLFAECNWSLRVRHIPRSDGRVRGGNLLPRAGDEESHL